MYESFASAGVTVNMILLFIVGLLVNSPYALITTAVSADLGTHPDFRGSSRALATVNCLSFSLFHSIVHSVDVSFRVLFLLLLF